MPPAPTPTHPAFLPFAQWYVPQAGAPLPGLAVINRWARELGIALPGGAPLTFVPPPAAALSAHDYERQIAATGCVATRADNLHDLCNALAWLRYPQTKAALNALHAAAPPAASANARDRCRDAATLVDESGILVACTDARLIALWRARRWRDAFADHRNVAARMRVVAIGHGLIAKLVAPFRAITGNALLLPVDAAALPADPASVAACLDAAAAAELASRRARLVPEDLLALPVAAVPGWDTERLGERLFDDAAVFRPRVLR